MHKTLLTAAAAGALLSAAASAEIAKTEPVKIDEIITDNWHIEDNLTLLGQMGIARVSP
jgi:hypothetical protein